MVLSEKFSLVAMSPHFVLAPALLEQAFRASDLPGGAALLEMNA
jgi:hypothetical protein